MRKIKKSRAYGEIKYSKDAKKWVITKLEPHVSIRIKKVFASIPAYSTVPFALENKNDICADLVWFMERYPLDISDADLRRLKSYNKAFYALQAEAEALLAPDYLAKEFSLKPSCRLRTHQSREIELLALVNGLLVGDKVGLGKTYTAIGAMTQKELLPAVVVVQTHLPSQWDEKIRDFSHLSTHIVKTPSAYNLPTADVYIFKYSQLRGWVEMFETGFFKSVFYDEIQDLRTGEESAKGASAAVLSANTNYRCGLSATPIYNYGGEIFNIYEFISPGCLGSRDDFLREWCDGYSTKAIVKDPEALGTYLRENHLFIRHTRKDVKELEPELPVNTIVENIDYDEQYAQDHMGLLRNLAIRVAEGSFTEQGRAARELDVHARLITGVSKARAVAQYVKLFLSNDEPVLLAGWHREVYRVWMEEFKYFNPLMYTGSESGAQKDRMKKAFISGESNIMMISLRSGSGLDGLQSRCSVVVHGELDWSPGVHEQVTGRLDREGQEDQVTSIFLTSEYGSDPLIVDTLGLKSSQANGIIDPGMGIQKVHSDKSRIKMLAEKFLDQQNTPMKAIKDVIGIAPIKKSLFEQ